MYVSNINKYTQLIQLVLTWCVSYHYDSIITPNYSLIHNVLYTIGIVCLLSMGYATPKLYQGIPGISNQITADKSICYIFIISQNLYWGGILYFFVIHIMFISLTDWFYMIDMIYVLIYYYFNIKLNHKS